MIGWLQGLIVDKSQPGKLVLNVHGVGYDIETSLSTFFQVESITGMVTLYIHTVVREDAFLLYGFIDKEERALFRALIKVSGIGPKLAIAILSSVSPKEFIQLITQENAQQLTRFPGIGKKTAERLVIEMKDSISLISQHAGIVDSKPAVATHFDEAISALESLGYSYQDAKKAVKHCDDGQKSCEQLIRQALQLFAKN